MPPKRGRKPGSTKRKATASAQTNEEGALVNSQSQLIGPAPNTPPKRKRAKKQLSVVVSLESPARRTRSSRRVTEGGVLDAREEEEGQEQAKGDALSNVEEEEKEQNGGQALVEKEKGEEIESTTTKKGKKAGKVEKAEDASTEINGSQLIGGNSSTLSIKSKAARGGKTKKKVSGTTAVTLKKKKDQEVPFNEANKLVDKSDISVPNKKENTSNGEVGNNISAKQKSASKAKNEDLSKLMSQIEKLISTSLSQSVDSKDQQKNVYLVDSILKDLSASKNDIFENYKKAMEKKNAISNNLISLLVQKVAALESQAENSNKGNNVVLNSEINKIMQDTANNFAKNNDGTKNGTATAAAATDSLGANFSRLSDKQKVQRLLKENQELKRKLDQAGSDSNPFQTKSSSNYKVTISELERTVERYEIIFDILESICGIRVNDIDDKDPNNLVFDCLQAGLNGQIYYQLILSRSSLPGDLSAASAGKKNNEENASSDEETEEVEMIYNPVLEDNDELIAELRKVLPDYFFEKLTFPVETLPQFYQKLSRALNKEQKGAPQ